MKNILLFISPFLFVGLLLGVYAIFGSDVVYWVLYIFIIIICLTFVGAVLVANLGD